MKENRANRLMHYSFADEIDSIHAVKAGSFESALKKIRRVLKVDDKDDSRELWLVAIEELD